MATTNREALRQYLREYLSTLTPAERSMVLGMSPAEFSAYAAVEDAFEAEP